MVPLMLSISDRMTLFSAIPIFQVPDDRVETPLFHGDHIYAYHMGVTDNGEVVVHGVCL